MIDIKHLIVPLSSTFTLTYMNLAFSKGSLNLLVGENGSGKTSLCRALLGLNPLTSGQYQLYEKDATQLSPQEIGCFLAYLPCENDLPFDYTFSDLVLMGRFRNHKGDIQSSDVEVLDKLATDFGVTYLLQRKLSQLSTGQKKLAQLLRVFITETPALLLDEPLAHLDQSFCELVKSHLCCLAKKGKIIIATTHSIDPWVHCEFTVHSLS